MISWFLVVPALVPVLVSLLLSSFFSEEMVFCFLVPARVPVLVSLLLSSFFSRKGVLFHHDLLVAPGSGSGSGGCLPSYLFFFFQETGLCSIMISWFLLAPVLVPVLSFVRKMVVPF